MSPDIPSELLALLAARDTSDRGAAWDAFLARGRPLMDTIGWHVGAPNARRAMMLVVTMLCASGTTGAAGAAIGRFLGPQQ